MSLKRIFLFFCCIGTPLSKGVALSIQQDIVEESSVISEIRARIETNRQRIDTLEEMLQSGYPSNAVVYQVMTEAALIARSLRDVSENMSHDMHIDDSTELQQHLDQQLDRLLAFTSHFTRTLELQITTLMLRSRQLNEQERHLLVSKYNEIVQSHEALGDLLSLLNPALCCYLHWCILLHHIETTQAVLGL